MKRFLLTGLSMAFITLCAQKVKVVQSEVNVGTTGFETPVTASFELKNNGSRHITISSVKTDCGCIKTDYPKKSISSGESFMVSVTYDARMLGHFTKQAAVYVKGSTTPYWLTMKGVVVADWQDYSKLYPYSYGLLLADVNNIEFDDVNKGDFPQTVINVFNNSEKAMVPNIQHLPSYLSAVSSPETLQPGKGGTVTLTLNSNQLKNYGLTQTTVYLADNLGVKVGSQTELLISVVLLPEQSHNSEATKQYSPRLKYSTDNITLGLVNGKKHKSDVIILSNIGRLPLEISALQMFTKGMTVTLDSEARLQN